MGDNGVNDESRTAPTNDKRWASPPEPSVAASPKYTSKQTPCVYTQPPEMGDNGFNDVSGAAPTTDKRWAAPPDPAMPASPNYRDGAAPADPKGSQPPKDLSGAAPPNDKRLAAPPDPSVAASSNYRGGAAPADPKGSHTPNDVSGAAPPAQFVPLPRCALLAQVNLKASGVDLEAFDDGQASIEECAPADVGEADTYGLAIQEDVPQETPESQNSETELSDPHGMIPAPLPVHPTTLLVRQASRNLVQEDYLRRWPQREYGYDLVYAVYNLRKMRGTGRVFINFEAYESAAAFRIEFDGFVDPTISSTDENGIPRPLIVEVADRQGFQAQVAHWECTLRREGGAECAPAVFIRGERQNFWEYAHSLEFATRHEDSARGLFYL